jgi:SulP family sulfate permease
VLVGYANGAALILIASQLPALLGVRLEHDEFFLRIWEAARALPRGHAPTLALGAALLALLVALRRYAPRAPAALVACVVAGLAAGALGLGAGGVAMLKPLPEGLPMPAVPAVSLADLRHLVPGALALAFLIFAEGVLLAQVLAAKRDEAIDADGELRALGVANVVAGFLGGFNVGASGSRSFTADAAGARTQVTQWVTVALLVAFMLWLSPVIGWLPRVALAAILIAAGIALVDLAGTRELWRMERRSFAMSVAVTLGVLVIGVLPGVLLGIAIALVRALLDLARPRDALLRRQSSDGRFHDLDDDEPGVAAPGILVYRLYAPLVFANARHVAERLRTLVAAASPPVRLVVLDLQAVTHVDVTAVEILRELYDELEGKGIDVRIARANRPLREQLNRWLGDHRLGHERFFPAASAAVDDWLATPGR